MIWSAAITVIKSNRFVLAERMQLTRTMFNKFVVSYCSDIIFVDPGVKQNEKYD